MTVASIHEGNDITTLNEDGILCARALDLWGFDAQLDMVIEEAAELIKAIQKFKRRPSETTAGNIADEHADVELMLLQLEFMMESVERKYPVHLNDARKFKRERLVERFSGSHRTSMPEK